MVEPGDDLDRMVFGKSRAAETVEEPSIRKPVRPEPEPELDDDDPPERLFTERAPRDRRASSGRRKNDFTPLPDGGGKYEPGDSKRGPLILACTIVVIGVFGAVVWNAYSKGLRPANAAATPMLASSGPFKTRPDVKAPKAPDIDASVFERIAPSEKQPAPAETPDVREETKAAVATTPAPAPKTATPAEAPPKAEPVKLATPKPAAAPPPKPAPQISPDAPISLTPAPVQTAAATPAPAKTEPAKPAASTPAALEGAYHPAFAADGQYVVQLAAPSTEAAAMAEWARRAKAAPDLMQSAERSVVRADVNGKTVYRLRAGSFASRADANAFCGAIKASGGDCFTAKKT